jgi:hypothetical protein
LNAAEVQRFCLACSHPLAETGTAACPECGARFDAADPRTFETTASRAIARRRRGRLASAVAWTTAALAAGCVVWSFVGMDRLLAFLAGIALSPLLIVVLVLMVLPMVPVRPRTRAIGCGSVLLLVTTIVTDWPYRLSHAMHRAALTAEATAILDGTSPVPTTGARIGMLHFRRIQVWDGKVGFQINGDGGGGEFLVYVDPVRLPNPRWIWINTNWEQDLGGGWYRVYQD